MQSKKSTRKYLKSFSRILISLALIGFFYPLSLGAEEDREAEIRSQIGDITREMERIEKEIAAYSSLYNATTKQAQTLQNALRQLETNRKKLLSELTLTEKKITKTSLTIEDLSTNIKETEKGISLNSKALASSIVYLNQLENDSSVEAFFKYDTLSQALDYAMGADRFQRKVNSEIIVAKDLRERLLGQRQTYESEKKKLLGYQSNLSNQKATVEYSQKEKDRLLATTKNKEAEYQRLLVEKRKQKEEFERNLFQYESELKLIVDPASIPTIRAGILSWPINDVFITQSFGKTVDSKRLYASGTHSGVDFRAAIGTPIKAALSGVVWATGNTDIAYGCYSYGKWVFVKHANGLSTLYAHLSQITAKPGQAVVTGDIVGYSGNTGYSTGPHLHLGLYATQGVQVQKYTASKYCKDVTIPLARPEAYLDPMAYLPKP